MVIAVEHPNNLTSFERSFVLSRKDLVEAGGNKYRSFVFTFQHHSSDKKVRTHIPLTFFDVT